IACFLSSFDKASNEVMLTLGVMISIFYGFLNFFFSSRRRHTRSKRDWSSDVCSSDLAPTELLAEQHRRSLAPLCEAVGIELGLRSEERRVGKECRYGWPLVREK